MPVFRPFNLKEFKQSGITKIFQSKSGWVWMGGKNVLLRFDGQEFEQISWPDSLADNLQITAISEIRDTLWLGFSNGNICFLPQPGGLPFPFLTEKNGKHALQIWQPEEGSPARAITDFASDATGGFWFSTYGEGLYCLKTNRLYQFNAADDKLSGDEIYSLAADGQGKIWAATDHGISICSMPQDGKKSVHSFGVADGLPDEIIPTLCPDSGGNMWIGTDQKGVCFFDVQKQRITFQTADWQFGAVTSLAVVNESELWIGTASNGVIRLDIQTGILTTMTENLPLQHDKIHGLLTDLEGGLWVVAEKSGVFRANARFSLLPNDFGNVQAVLKDSRHRLWAGGERGLFLFENGKFRQVLPHPENIISLFQSRLASGESEIWAGSFGKGVFILSPEGKFLKKLDEKNGLVNGSILSIAGSGDKIWLASLGGVTQIDVGHRTLGDGQKPTAVQSPMSKIQSLPSLGSNYIYKVYADRRGRIWFGTDGNGLAVLDSPEASGQVRHFTSANGLPLKTVLSIAEDLAGRIWFTVSGQGLFCLDGEKFRHFGKEERLHSLEISSLAVAGSGELVISYPDGLDLLNPETDHLFFFDAETGIPVAETNLNAAFSDESGNVWMGTSQGILRVASGNFRFIIDPKTQFTTISLFQKPFDFQSKKSFAHDENYLAFDFIGLWYAQPTSVRYRFRLEGFDPDWKISKEHIASYPNLQPGNYIFRVQSSEHGRFEGTEEASFSFKIRRPFWAEWWFLLPAAGLFFFLILKFVKNREARLRRVEKLTQEKIASQFETLKSQINPHFLFNSFNTLITIIEENPKIAVEYVEHLSDFFRTIMVYREKDLIPIQEELELVKNFNFLLKKRFEDNFQLVSNINGQQGFVMPLTLQMLVENAVKHNIISKTRPLKIEIFVENGEFLVVKNNIQRKIKPESGTHFGLQSLMKRYKLLGQRQVEVVDDGAFFMVKVPIL